MKQGDFKEAVAGGILGGAAGGCAGLAVGVVLCVMGGLACLTGVGALLGAPMVLVGIACPFFMAGLGGATAAEESGGLEKFKRSASIALLAGTVVFLIWFAQVAK